MRQPQPTRSDTLSSKRNSASNRCIFQFNILCSFHFMWIRSVSLKASKIFSNSSLNVKACKTFKETGLHDVKVALNSALKMLLIIFFYSRLSNLDLSQTIILSYSYVRERHFPRLYFTLLTCMNVLFLRYRGETCENFSSLDLILHLGFVWDLYIRDNRFRIVEIPLQKWF